MSFLRGAELGVRAATAIAAPLMEITGAFCVFSFAVVAQVFQVVFAAGCHSAVCCLRRCCHELLRRTSSTNISRSRKCSGITTCHSLSLLWLACPYFFNHKLLLKEEKSSLSYPGDSTLLNFELLYIFFRTT